MTLCFVLIKFYNISQLEVFLYPSVDIEIDAIEIGSNIIDAVHLFKKINTSAFSSLQTYGIAKVLINPNAILKCKRKYPALLIILFLFFA